MTPAPVQPVVIAYRKACRPNGVGLSHYVLLTNPAPRESAPEPASTR